MSDVWVGPHWITVCDGYSDVVFYGDGARTKPPFCVHHEVEGPGGACNDAAPAHEEEGDER